MGIIGEIEIIYILLKIFKKFNIINIFLIEENVVSGWNWLVKMISVLCIRIENVNKNSI